MPIPGLPPKFNRFLEQNTKTLNIVVQIEGVNDILSSATVGSTIRYGDGTVYGETINGVPIVYGGLRPYRNDLGGVSHSYLDLNGSSLVLQQKMEQEQGRSSISQLSLAFVDVNSYMTNLVTPGKVVPEIIGREVKVYIGFQEISYPEDYYLTFRGRIQAVKTKPGLVTLQLGDPNLRRRRTVFFSGRTAITSPITNTAQVIPVASNSDFNVRILGPDGTDDPSVKTYLLIEEEFIEYNRQAFGSNVFTNVPAGAVVTRGARGSSAVAHDATADVTACVEISGHPMSVALKTMLSGWNGPYKTNEVISSLVFTGDPLIGSVPRAIVLPDRINAVLDLGLSIGDYITIKNALNPANNLTTRVVSFQAASGYPNKLIIVANDLVSESFPTTAVMDLRSQYDTWPILCGLKMFPWEVDVAAHQSLQTQFTAQELMRGLISQTENNGKAFIESQCYLPISAYSLTRQGQLSVKLTLPPIADQRLQVLDVSNITNATEITTERSTTNRNFWNEYDVQYDERDLGGDYARTFRFLDAESLDQVGLLAIIPITSKLTKSDLTSETTLQNRANRFLTRYSRAAVIIRLRVNFRVGAPIEVGDVQLLRDNGLLQIPNFNTGLRNLGDALMEVKEKSFDLKNGYIDLTLIGSVGFNAEDKFATWAPSSKVLATGSTFDTIRIADSYGAIFGIGNEYLKWTEYVGTRVRVHNASYSVDEERTLVFASNTNTLTVDPPLSFIPNASHVVDFAKYSTVNDVNVDAIQKLIHCFWSRTAPIVSGISGTVFTLGASDAALLVVGFTVIVRNASYSVLSDEIPVQSVVGNTVTLESSLGFTPNNTYVAELIPFYDGRPSYRFI